jgi:hypothetical protein
LLPSAVVCPTNRTTKQPALVTAQNIGRELGGTSRSGPHSGRWRAQQGQRASHISGEDVEGARDAGSSAGHEAVEVGAPDETGTGAQADGGDDVGAAADAAGEVDLRAVADLIEDGR